MTVCRCSVQRSAATFVIGCALIDMATVLRRSQELSDATLVTSSGCEDERRDVLATTSSSFRVQKFHNLSLSSAPRGFDRRPLGTIERFLSSETVAEPQW